ncbi:MAG: hypothetical protein OXQ94_11035 [Gemmatimonadota bacterium]|nr:hypothetical protein [Gemmatimonadota bacterium]MDE2872203.1 hypothetical protein [Gemmatimonadota bacterium]
MRASAGSLVAVLLCANVLEGCSQAGSNGSSESSETLAVGQPLASVRLSGDRPALLWVFDVEQCLGCELGDPARVVRGLQRGLGERLETVALAIGDGRAGDREIVSTFLASQRITGRIEMRSHEQYRRDFGGAPLSVFYIMNRNSVVEAAVATDSLEIWRSTRDRLGMADFVARLVEEGVGQAGEGSGS